MSEQVYFTESEIVQELERMKRSNTIQSEIAVRAEKFLDLGERIGELEERIKELEEKIKELEEKIGELEQEIIKENGVGVENVTD